MTENWRVEMVVLDELGRVQARAILPVDPFDAHEQGLTGLTPPSEFDFRTLGQTITVLKKREKRKGWLREACDRLGLKCAETMEDLEGWHGKRRAELTRRTL